MARIESEEGDAESGFAEVGWLVVAARYLVSGGTSPQGVCAVLCMIYTSRGVNASKCVRWYPRYMQEKSPIYPRS